MTPEQALEEGAKWSVRALGALLGWLGLDYIRRIRKHGERLVAIEKNQALQVTRNQLDELRASTNASIENGFNMVAEQFEHRFSRLENEVGMRSRAIEQRVDRLFERLPAKD